MDSKCLHMLLGISLMGGDFPINHLCLQDVVRCCFLQFSVPEQNQSVGVGAALLGCPVVRSQNQLWMLVGPVHRRHHTSFAPAVVKQGQLLCHCGTHTRATAGVI